MDENRKTLSRHLGTAIGFILINDKWDVLSTQAQFLRNEHRDSIHPEFVKASPYSKRLSEDLARASNSSVKIASETPVVVIKLVWFLYARTQCRT